MKFGVQIDRVLADVEGYGKRSFVKDNKKV